MYEFVIVGIDSCCVCMLMLDLSCWSSSKGDGRRLDDNNWHRDFLVARKDWKTCGWGISSPTSLWLATIKNGHFYLEKIEIEKTPGWHILR